MKINLKSLIKEEVKTMLENLDLKFVQNKGQVSFPKPKGININMMPFVFGDKSSLPKEYHGYLPLIEKANFAKGSVAYLTIHESVVEKGSTQRRPGLHTDGTNGELAESLEGSSLDEQGSWGGGFHGGAWGGGWQRNWDALKAKKKSKDKKSKPEIDPKKKKKLSESDDLVEEGGWGGGWGGIKESKGIYIASSDGTCNIYDAYVSNKNVDKHGGTLKESVQNTKCVSAKPSTMYWITDRTPHESIPVKETTNRQFFRLVSEDIHAWYKKHSTPNPLGIEPKCPIVDVDKFAK